MKTQCIVIEFHINKWASVLISDRCIPTCFLPQRRAAPSCSQAFHINAKHIIKVTGMELYNIDAIYRGYVYPAEYAKIVKLNLLDFEKWYLMSNEQIDTRIKGLKSRYPSRDLIPFARRDDNDDIACFEVGKSDRVQIIHDFAGQGFEQRKEYECFWDWFRAAIDEMTAETGE